MLKEFDSVVASNKEILIWCFCEGLRPLIQAQINSQHQELNFWDKVLDKPIDVKSKAELQSLTSICEMDACYWKSQRLDKKKETSKPLKEDNRARPADSQPTLSSSI